MLFHPSGGLIYHGRALRWQRTLWRPFHAAVAQWLAQWLQQWQGTSQHKAEQLVLVGPSGGYALNADFLAHFARLTVLEPDGLARRILQHKFPACRFEMADEVTDSPTFKLAQPDGFDHLAQYYPKAAFLFCNLFGQQLMGSTPAHFERQRWLIGLVPAMQGHIWASWHDLASTTRPPDVMGVCHHAQSEALADVLAHYWHGGELEIYDHECSGICPELPRQTAIWQLTAKRYHLIEWLHSA
jgi:hypothetical protein